MRKLILSVLALPLLVAAAIKTGPEIGAKIPNFAAIDQNSQSRKLYDLLGPKGGLLVIYRSADW